MFTGNRFEAGRQDRTTHCIHRNSGCTGSLNLIHKAPGLAALFGQNCLRTETGNQRSLVIFFVIDQTILREALTGSLLQRLFAAQDPEPAVVPRPIAA